MTTTVLRPNATTDTGGATVTGAATIHAAMSDNSDASYAAQITGGLTVLEMTTQALGANDVTKSSTVRMRCFQSSGAYANQLNVRIPGAIGAPGYLTIFPVPTVAGTTFTSAIRAIDRTSAQVAALQFEFFIGGFGTVRMYEVSCDLVWVAGAVTTITYPTGSPVLASSSSITATWTSVVDADADGATRDRYRVKIFTAAQYGAGGFDPETSTAFYDSGEVVSTNQSQVVPNLTNTTTYRTFVKVGDRVNGVSHWGAWAGGAASQFSTAFTTADILSVVGTPNNANARISVLVTRVTAGPPPTWQTVEVQRSTDAGATWLPVRAATNVAVSGSTFTVLDYEAPNSAAVLYRAHATYTTGGNSVVGPWTASTPAVSWTAAADWLKHPSHPALNRTVTVKANPQRTRRRRRGIHSVIGRADPVVVSDILNLSEGTLTFLTATDTEAEDLLALLDYDVLFFQPRPGARFGQKYIAIGDVNEIPETDVYNVPSTRWPVEWVEVLIPIDVGQT